MDYSSYDFAENDKQPGSPTQKSPRIARLVIKGLSIALIIFLLPFVTSHCLPLLKPVGVSVLQRLWDVLRFIVITTAISFGILNSQWKAMERDPEAEDKNQSPRAPRLDAIFREMEESKEQSDASDLIDGKRKMDTMFQVTNASSREIAEDYENIAPSANAKRSAAFPVEAGFQANKLVTSMQSSETWVSTLGSGANIGVLQEAQSISRRSGMDAHRIDRGISGSSSKVRPNFNAHGFVVSRDEGQNVVKKSHAIPGTGREEHSIIQRRVSIRPENDDDNGKSRKRSSSLDRTFQPQSAEVSIATVKASNATVNASNANGKRQSEATKMGTLDGGRKNAASANKFVMSSRHSKSALNLDQFDDGAKSEKPWRRNASLSVDFDEEYSPDWLYDEYPPPPQLPSAVGTISDTENDEAPSPMGSPQSTATPSSQLSTLRSSPVDINPSVSNQQQQQQLAAVEEASTPISPSPGELNRKADAFIAKFREQMRLQRVESFERSRKRLDRGFY